MLNLKPLLYLSIALLMIVSANAAGKGKSVLVSSTEAFTQALINVQPGDTIILKNGTYTDVKINFKPAKNGLLNKPITLIAEQAGKVVLKGNAQLALLGNYLQVSGFLFDGVSTLPSGDVLTFGADASHCRITNCAVINYTPKDVMVNNNWVSMQGTYNEVDHCYFSGKTNQGPYLVVRYKKDVGYLDGSDSAPSTYHHIHHNYFGYRTLPTDNGGEDLRIGDSFTSFTHGFNIIEYNFFEEHRLEAEVISNKSWDNIYRFNTFVNNDGQMVLRHGQKCFVYGNYFDGKTGRGTSGGIRIINANQTVFNNYIANAEASNIDASKGGVVVMSGLLESPLNGYYPADNALVAYNTMVNCEGPVIKLAYGNKSKGKPFVAPTNVTIIGNSVLNTIGKNLTSIEILDARATFVFADNCYNVGATNVQGFTIIKSNKINTKKGLLFAKHEVNTAIVDTINQRLSVHNINLTSKEIMEFDASKVVTKKDVGTSWFY